MLDDRLLTLHVSLGVLIIALALVRLAWRRIDGLPPWSDRLGPRGRLVATWNERCLLALLIVIPATGLVLVLSDDDDVLWLHVAAHITFFVALAVHCRAGARQAADCRGCSDSSAVERPTALGPAAGAVADVECGEALRTQVVDDLPAATADGADHEDRLVGRQL